MGSSWARSSEPQSRSTAAFPARLAAAPIVAVPIVVDGGGTMRIRGATKSDLSAVENLLAASELPIDGVRDNFSSFVVADDDGAIAGAIGLEKYGSVALLRSAVVAPEHRGSGVGRRLVEQLLERAE